MVEIIRDSFKTVKDRVDWEIKLDILDTIKSKLKNESEKEIVRLGTRQFEIKKYANVSNGKQYKNYMDQLENIDKPFIISRTVNNIKYYFKTDLGEEFRTSMNKIKEDLMKAGTKMGGEKLQKS